MGEQSIKITTPIAQELIYQQFPQFAQLFIRQLDTHGTVNSIFRIGEDYLARFPQHASSLPDSLSTVERGMQAAREFSLCSTVESSLPVGIGYPNGSYPSYWSVYTWVPGVIATSHWPGSSIGFAHDVAQFIIRLHAADTQGKSFSGTGRGGDLRDHDAWIQHCLSMSQDLLHVPFLSTLWEQYRELPRKSPDTMTHGDLIPDNILVAGDHLIGILDVDNFGPADPALDFIVAWHLLDALPRQVFRTQLSCDGLDWERGKAWAFAQSMGLIWYYLESNPAMSLLGAHTLLRLIGNSCPELIINPSPLHELLKQNTTT